MKQSKYSSFVAFGVVVGLVQAAIAAPIAQANAVATNNARVQEAIRVIDQETAFIQKNLDQERKKELERYMAMPMQQRHKLGVLRFYDEKNNKAVASVIKKNTDLCGWICIIFSLPRPNFWVYATHTETVALPDRITEAQVFRVIEEDANKFYQRTKPYRILDVHVAHCTRNGKAGWCAYHLYDLRPPGGRDLFFMIGRFFLLAMALSKYYLAGKNFQAAWAKELANNVTRLKGSATSIFASLWSSIRTNPKFFLKYGKQNMAEVLGVIGQTSLTAAAFFWQAEGLNQLREVFYTREFKDNATDHELRTYLEKSFKQIVRDEKWLCKCSEYDRFLTMNVRQFLLEHKRKISPFSSKLLEKLNSSVYYASSNRHGQFLDLFQPMRVLTALFAPIEPNTQRVANRK